MKLNQAEWDLFEFRFGSQIKVLPTTLTVIGDGLFLSEEHHDQLSDSVLYRLFNRAKKKEEVECIENQISCGQTKFSDPVVSMVKSTGLRNKYWVNLDTYPTHGDRPTAWAPAINRKTSTEFIRVGFAKPIHMEGLKIYETCNPGAINQVFAIDQNGVQHTVWQNHILEITTLKKRIFRLNMPTTSYYKVSSIEIHLIPANDGSLNQIDAVGIIYPQD